MHRIMVVDDEVIITAHLERRLQHMGYHVVGRANSGERSVDMAECLRPDLILMDIVMPGAMDGIDAAGKIREQMDIPIIFMTAYADDQYVKRAKQVEPYGYILKPFQEDEVKAAIEVALYRKEMERDLSRSMEQLRVIVDTINDAVVSLDAVGRIIFCNRKATDLFGYRSDEMMGKNFASLLSREAGQCLEQVLNGDGADTEGGDAWMGARSCRGTGKNGGEFSLRLTPTVHQVRDERFITCIIREESPAPSLPPTRSHSGDAAETMISICSYCNRVRDEHGYWNDLTDYLYRKMDIMFSHGICPTCMESLFSNLERGE